MDFVDFVVTKHSIEMPIHIRSKTKMILLLFGYFLEYVVTVVWLLLPVHFQPVTIEAPKHLRTMMQKHRIGTLVKIELVPIWWIVVPEALIASEVRET